MEETPVTLSRLRWRCRRGMRELDLLLQGFLDNGYMQLDTEGKALFVRLLTLPDQTLFDYLLGDGPAGEREFADVIERIRRTAAD